MVTEAVPFLQRLLNAIRDAEFLAVGDFVSQNLIIDSQPDEGGDTVLWAQCQGCGWSDSAVGESLVDDLAWTHAWKEHVAGARRRRDADTQTVLEYQQANQPYGDVAVAVEWATLTRIVHRLAFVYGVDREDTA